MISRASSLLSTFNESSVNDIESDIKDYILRKYDSWRTDYPDEKELIKLGLDYMEPEFDRSRGTELPWVLKALREGRYSTKLKNAKPCNVVKRACYYNALTYLYEYPDEGELGVGIHVEFSKHSKPYPPDFTYHAFVVTPDNKIIDPTWKRSGPKGPYFYEIVPKSKWELFKYQKNDVDFDARDVRMYLERTIERERKKFNFSKWIRQ